MCLNSSVLRQEVWYCVLLNFSMNLFNLYFSKKFLSCTFRDWKHKKTQGYCPCSAQPWNCLSFGLKVELLVVVVWSSEEGGKVNQDRTDNDWQQSELSSKCSNSEKSSLDDQCQSKQTPQPFHNYTSLSETDHSLGPDGLPLDCTEVLSSGGVESFRGYKLPAQCSMQHLT